MSFDLTPPSHHISEPEAGVIEVPYQRLSEAALTGIIEEFVSREGTDYGDYNYSFDDKKAQVMQQLQQGIAVILFDASSGSCHIELKSNLADFYRITQQ